MLLSSFQQLLETNGNYLEKEHGIWFNSIKSHCYAMYTTRSAAENAFNALNGSQWNNKPLSVTWGDKTPLQASQSTDSSRDSLRSPITPITPKVGQESFKIETKTAATNSQRSDPLPSPQSHAPQLKASLSGEHRMLKNALRGLGTNESTSKPTSSESNVKAKPEAVIKRPLQDAEEPRPKRERIEPDVFSPDDMFQKTKTRPNLYWLPISEEEVGMLIYCLNST